MHHRLIRVVQTLSSILMIMLASQSACAQVHKDVWQVNEGDWALAANWFDTLAGATATNPPGADDSASIGGVNSLTHYNLDGSGALLQSLEVYNQATLAVESGVLETEAFAVGRNGAGNHGIVTQSGGSVQVSGLGQSLFIGGGDAANASQYTLNGGLLQTTSTWIGRLSVQSSTPGFGRFVHTAGTHDTGAVVVETNSVYELSNTGNLLVGELQLQTGSSTVNSGFFMSGGSVAVDRLDLSAYSVFDWSGGAMTVESLQMRHDSQFVLPTGPSSLTMAGVVDLSGGSVVNKANASWTLAPQSLLILPADGSDPRTDFAGFVTGGKVHQAGQTFVLGESEEIRGARDFADPYDLAGTINGQVYSVFQTGGVVRATAQLSNTTFSLEGDEHLTIEGGSIQGGLTARGPSSGSGPAPTVHAQNADLDFISMSLDRGAELVVDGGTIDGAFLTVDTFGVSGTPPLTHISLAHTTATFISVQLGTASSSNNKNILLELGEGAQLWTGSFRFGAPHVGIPPTSASTRLHFAGDGAELHVTTFDLAIYEDAEITAASSGAIVLHGTDFDNWATDEADFSGLDDVTITAATSASGHDLCLLEVAGRDLGPTLDGFDLNFSLEGLVIGDGSPAKVSLYDHHDNQPNWIGTEALYVDSLTINAGSTLYLNGINLYTHTFDNLGTINTTGGQVFVVPVPEPTSLLLLLTGGALLLRRR